LEAPRPAALGCSHAEPRQTGFWFTSVDMVLLGGPKVTVRFLNKRLRF